MVKLCLGNRMILNLKCKESKMKLLKGLTQIVIAGIAAAAIVGCGGGGGGGGGSAPVAPSSGLTADKANKQLLSVASLLGCSYTTTASASDAELGIVLAAKTIDVIKNLAVNNDVTMDTSAPMIASANGNIPAIAAVYPGTCGGSLTMPDLYIGTYQFDNFCYTDPSTGASATIDGSLNIQYDGSVKIDTITPLTIVTSNPPLNVTVEMSGGVIGLNGLDLESINSISIASLVITNNATGARYTITNVNAYLNGDVITLGGAINDPSIGDIIVEGTVNNVTGSANLTATDQFGNAVTISGSNSVYTATHNGAPLGTMDCSSAQRPSIPSSPL